MATSVSVTVGTSPRRSPRKDDVQSGASSKSPRKQHCCTHCGRTRANHPRSGCPYVDPPIASRAASPKQTTPGNKAKEPDRLDCADVDALSLSLAIATLRISPLPKAEDPPTDVEDATDHAEDHQVLSSPTTPSARRTALRRTSSYEVWSAFVQQYGLDERDTAHVIPVEASKVEEIERAAKGKGFATRVVIQEGSKIGCLIVGKERAAVDKLHDSVRCQQQRPSLKVVSASAVLGALAAWAVLAFA
ncbi:hypothetical protein OBBRIDRAFT_162511 [Obba rivulosa]|uniref:Uncharacterized protein n=1 Tax=Obba rivulosa TaxID=1052685 RepID=A0A8E2J459_9APHY|nr:hypothetical protein OBBRIDRAFT_162511 [Obba rivulosa]